MKKILFISSVTIFMFFIFIGLMSAQTIDKSALVGTWQLCEASGKLVTTRTVRVKFITIDSFTVSEIHQDTKTCSAYFIGNYSIKNGVYSENITYATSQLHSFVGMTNNFSVELKGDYLYLKGVGNPFNEIWQRVSK